MDKLDNKKSCGAVITAAGMSSRMGAFKPLLPMGTASMIELLVANFQSLGIDRVVVVTGFRADDIRRHLEHSGVEFVHNPEYERSHMLDSVKLGLDALRDMDEVVVTPVDVPLFSSFTVKKLMESHSPAAIPIHDGRRGHPILLQSGIIPAILGYMGGRGLAGALESLPEGSVRLVEVSDPAVLPGANTPGEYFLLLRMVKSDFCPSGDVPSTEECLGLLLKYGASADTMLHCAAVARRALDLAEGLNRAGLRLNLSVVYCGALLHDIARHLPGHAKTGAEWLRREGYADIARVVEGHMELEAGDLQNISEVTVVFYADKLFQGRKEVSIRQRFAENKNAFDTPEALQSRQRRWLQAERVEKMITEMLG